MFFLFTKVTEILKKPFQTMEWKMTDGVNFMSSGNYE